MWPDISASTAVNLIVECDGGARGNPGVAGFGAVVLLGSGPVDVDINGDIPDNDDAAPILAERAGYLGITTNNVAEYSGLVAGLTAAYLINPNAQVTVRMDSQLVVEQMSGRWKIKKGELIELARQAALAFPPEQVAYEWVPRSQNSRADALANLAMDTKSAVARDYPLPATSASAGLETTATEPVIIPGTGAFRNLDPAACLTLILVRHGVTAHTTQGLLAGGDSLGLPLSPSGQRMARGAAHALAELTQSWPDLPPPSSLIASPMTRAQQTAEAISHALHLPVQTDPRLREIEFGAWHELSLDEVEARWPGQFRRMYREGTFAPPGGESYADTAKRVGSVVNELAQTALGQTVVIVGHAAMIRAIVGPLLGIPVSRWSQIRIPPCSLSIVRIWPDAESGLGATELVCLGVPTTAS